MYEGGVIVETGGAVVVGVEEVGTGVGMIGPGRLDLKKK